MEILHNGFFAKWQWGQRWWKMNFGEAVECSVKIETNNFNGTPKISHKIHKLISNSILMDFSNLTSLIGRLLKLKLLIVPAVWHTFATVQ